MPFVYDPQGNLLTQDHNGVKLPVFRNADGKEAPFDGDATIASISARNREAQSHRERAEALAAELEPFKAAGLTDAAAAKNALETVANLKDGDLVKAGDVERVKAEAIKSVRAEFEPIVAERDTLKRDLYGEKIGGAFARSPFIVGEKAKVVIPPDLMQARFGQQFSVENGRVVAKGANGETIYSRTRHGEPADFDEALEIIVDQYPHKEAILKGSGASGGGASGTSGGSGGRRTITRAQYEAMPPAERQAAGLAAGKGEAVIVD